LELERQLSESLAERDQRIARLTDELALKSALLEQAEANAVEAARRADDLRLMWTSLVKQRDVELADILRDMRGKLDELVVSRDRQVGQYEEELANVRAKLEAKEAKFEAKETELESVRLRLTDAEKGLTKSKAEADILRAQTATGSVNRDEDVIRRLMERMRDEMTSKRWNEKSADEMECRNEG